MQFEQSFSSSSQRSPLGEFCGPVLWESSLFGEFSGRALWF